MNLNLSLKIWLGFFLLAVLSKNGTAVNTAKIGNQAPGYYRTHVGDIEVTTLFDGAFPMPAEKFLGGAKPGVIQKLLNRSFEEPLVTTSVDGFLVNTGAKLVLIDTGTGSLMGPRLGQLVANLKASGYQPEQVDEIYITHMHPDHIGGLTTEGKRVFSNAVVRANKLEGDFWLSQTLMNKETNPEKKKRFEEATALLKPYVDAGKFKPFEGEGELVPGIRSLPLLGHTPGHSGYLIESKDKKLVLLGDLLHVASVQFAEPSFTMVFDEDPARSAAQRKSLFERAAKERFLIGSAHLPFPGLGHVRQETKNFSFVPIDYEPAASK